MRKFALLLAPVAMLAGCASTPDPIGGSPSLTVIQGDLPAPSQADYYDLEGAFLVGPYDVLKIDVFGVTELSNREVRVDGNGMIAFPLIGEVDVRGLTPSQVSAIIAERLRDNYIRDPRVTTNVESSENRTVTVYGEVQQPGVFPVQGRTTLIRAVARARGLAEFADARDVVVFRTVDGQRMATLYNLDAISRGAYDDPLIYPNDTVVVGESDARRLFQDIVGVATVLVTPVTLLLQRAF
ncbi:polysaccharide biosynthesis/export family protein [Alteriqipengyuania sp. 357]